MVITCPSCSARYRLNQDKIKGRGAKITCPKCSHIFVVFSDGETEAEKPPEAAASPPKASPKAPPAAPPVPKAPDTLGDRLSQRDKATTTGAFKAVGLEGDDGPSSTTTGSIRVVAPGPRKSRRKTATTLSTASREGLPVVKPGEPPEDSIPPNAASTGEIDIPMPSSASDLDFREVGITTWKVKVAIGLIYDFSDISTLKKYLTDKKVTEDDLISHNAKDWVRIGDITDLDTHFIETWRSAKAEKLARGSKAKVKKPKPAADASSSSAGTGASSTYGGPGASSTFGAATGSYGSTTGQQRTRPRKPRKPAVEEKPSRTGLYLLAAVLVLGLVGWFAFGRPEAPGPVTTTTPSGPAAGGIAPSTDADAEQERIRERIREQVEEQRRRMEAEARATGDDDDVVEEEYTPKLEPVPQRPGGVSAPTPRPAPGARTPRPAPGAIASATPTPQSSQSTQTDQGGSLWFGKAKEQFAGKNYGKALGMVDRAIAKCGTCADYWNLKGDIHTALNEPQDAAAAYQKAGSLGSAVNRAGP